VLTIEKPGGIFDAIVLGELAESKWMAGSNGFARTQKDQAANPTRRSAKRWSKFAIVYRGSRSPSIATGRSTPTTKAPGAEQFGGDSSGVMGLRHLDAGPDNRFFHRHDRRCADLRCCAERRADCGARSRISRPIPPPLAWWDFENGAVADRMGCSPPARCCGDARIADGRLHLDGDGAYLVASRNRPTPSLDLSDSDSANRAFREAC
jgi:beta-fructofuranosidase